MQKLSGATVRTDNYVLILRTMAVMLFEGTEYKSGSSGLNSQAAFFYCKKLLRVD